MSESAQCHKEPAQGALWLSRLVQHFYQHRKFLGCDVDHEMLSTAEPDLGLTFACQVLNRKTDISEIGKVDAAAEVFTDNMGALLAGTKGTVWEVSPELNGTLVMPGHILHFLSALYENYSMCEMCRQTSLSMSLPMWRSWLYLTDTKIFWLIRAAVLGCRLKGRGLLTRRRELRCLLAGFLDEEMWWGSNTAHWLAETLGNSGK